VAKFVLDTNVYIQAIRNATRRRELAAWQRRMGPHLYQHAVVVSELLVGARDGATWRRWHERWVAPAERVERVIVPGRGDWLRASQIVVRLTEAGELGPAGLGRTFFNDCLLAATARARGFIIVTHNLGDFERIARVEPGLRAMAPLP
jgi:predicted nucleic acid-binding protein